MKIFSSLIILLEIVSLIYICTRYNKSYQSIDLNMLALTWQWHYVSCLEHKSTVRNFLPLNYCSLNEFALKKKEIIFNMLLYSYPSVWYFRQNFLICVLKILIKQHSSVDRIFSIALFTSITRMSSNLHLYSWDKCGFSQFSLYQYIWVYKHIKMKKLRILDPICQFNDCISWFELR